MTIQTVVAIVSGSYRNYDITQEQFLVLKQMIKDKIEPKKIYSQYRKFYIQNMKIC